MASRSLIWSRLPIRLKGLLFGYARVANPFAPSARGLVRVSAPAVYPLRGRGY